MNNQDITEAGLFPHQLFESTSALPNIGACAETPVVSGGESMAAEVIATQRAALDSHYATREQIIAILHSALDGPARIAAVDKVLELLAAEPAPPVSLPTEHQVTDALDQLEGYFNRESLGFTKCAVLREALAVGSTRSQVHNLALEAAMAVCRVRRSWAEVDSIRALKAPGVALPTEPASLDRAQALAAARWNAFLASAYINPLGSAGLTSPMPNNYAHLGVEVWTNYGAPGEHNFDKENALGRTWLTLYADIAIAAQAKST